MTCTELMLKPSSVQMPESALGSSPKCNFHLTAPLKIELHGFHFFDHVGHRVPESLRQASWPHVITKSSHFNPVLAFCAV